MGSERRTFRASDESFLLIRNIDLLRYRIDSAEQRREDFTMIGDTRVGRVLAGLRDQRGVIQADLAVKVGIHPSTLSKYENLGRIPEEIFLRICEVLSYDPDTVVEAALQLFRQDLRQAQLARSASISGEGFPEKKRTSRSATVACTVGRAL